MPLILPELGLCLRVEDGSEGREEGEFMRKLASSDGACGSRRFLEGIVLFAFIMPCPVGIVERIEVRIFDVDVLP